MTGFDVSIVGGSGVDTLVRVGELTSLPGESVGLRPIRDYVTLTGNGVAPGLHALGSRTTLLDYVGDVEQGRLRPERYREAGLIYTGLPAPAGTRRSVNLVRRRGRRFSFCDGRHPADLRTSADIAGPLVRDARSVHLTRADHARELLRAAAEGDQLAGVRPGCRRARRGRDPGGDEPPAGTGADDPQLPPGLRPVCS